MPKLLLLLLSLSASAQVKNPDTYTYLTIYDADSLDPAWSYDSESELFIQNMYETLVAFDGSSLEKLVPRAASKVPSRANGLISKDGRVYTFPIRKGLKFHDGAPLTPEDVRYSILRFMLQDRDAGPSGLLLQPLLGVDSTRRFMGVVTKAGDKVSTVDDSIYQRAAEAVQVNGDDVVITLKKPFAPLLTVFASWAPVVSKQWAVKNGDWDGTEATWTRYNNPSKETSPFYEREDGSGPFKLARWDRKTSELVMERFDGYWRGPAKLKRVVTRGVPEFSTRKLLLQAGDADSIYAQEPEHNQLVGMPGVTLLEGLPMVDVNPAVYFTFKINPLATQAIHSGLLDGNGIPPDFFTDKDVRLAFAYSIDYAGYLKDVKRGLGSQATGCVPSSLPGHNPKQEKFTFDPKKAEEHFRKAWGGKVWENGFYFTLSYNEGNQERAVLCQMLKKNVEALNPKFRIDVRPIEWPAFLDASNSSKLPMFLLAWQADFPDAHNFAYPMLHSEGNYPKTQRYANPGLDKLIEAAAAEPDSKKRKQAYFAIQKIEHEDVPHLVIVDAVRYRAQRDWVRGYVHNPIAPDSPYGSYFYTMYKKAK